jgi:hypothetical protein
VQHLDGKTAEAREVPVGAKVLADTGAAHFEHVGRLEQAGGFDRLAEGTAEGRTILQAHIATIGPPDHNLDRERDAVTEEMNLLYLKTVGISDLTGNLLEVGDEGMGQGKRSQDRGGR